MRDSRRREFIRAQPPDEHGVGNAHKHLPDLRENNRHCEFQRLRRLGIASEYGCILRGIFVLFQGSPGENVRWKRGALIAVRDNVSEDASKYFR